MILSITLLGRGRKMICDIAFGKFGGNFSLGAAFHFKVWRS